MNKKILTLLIVILIAAGAYLYFSKPTPANGESIKIGAALGLTGYGAGWAEGEQKAIQLATDELNQNGGIGGKPVQIIVEDTKSTPEGTVNAVKKLVEVDQVTAILGPTWGDSFQGANPLLEQSKTPAVSPSSAIEVMGDKEKYSYIFSTWWPQRPEHQVLIDYLKSKGITKVASVNDIDAFDSKAVDIFNEMAVASGLTNVDHQQVPIGTTDFRTVILRLKNSGAQAVYIELQDTSAIGPFNAQYKQLDAKIQVFSTINIENPENLKKFPNVFDGIIYSYPSVVGTPAYETFAKKFKAKFGVNPEGPSVTNGYNAAQILFAALETAPQGGEALRDALYMAKASGIGVDPLNFDHNGQIGNVQYVIKTIKNNQFVVVE